MNGTKITSPPYRVAFDGCLKQAWNLRGTEPDIRRVAADMALTLMASRPVSSVIRSWGVLSAEGYYFGSRDNLICFYRTGDESSRYRSYGEALAAYTSSRVRLVEARTFQEQLPAAELLLEGPVTNTSEVGALRARLRQSLEGVCSPRHWLCLQLLLSELATNTVVHGTGGRIQVFRDGRSVWLLSEDNGPGFTPLRDLPLAILKRGHSSARRNLGLGYRVIVEQSRRVVLTTGSRGTRCLVQIDAPLQEGLKTHGA